MAQHRFSAHAQRDLINIINYTIENWGKTQANIYIDGLEELAENLAKSPTLGTRRNDLKDGLFSSPYQSHILFYKLLIFVLQYLISNLLQLFFLCHIFF